MFENKFSNHEYREEITKKFEEDIPIAEIVRWLIDKGDEYKLSNDTLIRHKKRYMNSLNEKKEIEKVEKEFGKSTEIEKYLLETIAQCRVKKKDSALSGKDYQYYDQQMQSAIKVLREIRGTEKPKAGLGAVFKKLAEDIQGDKKQVDEGTVPEGTDNKVS